MFFKIAALLFFLIPLLEILIFQQFPARLLPWLAGTQLITAFIGWRIIRKFDFNQLFFLEAEIRKGSPIVKELWEESIVIFSALLLMVPGIFSDLAGALLLHPLIRKWLMDNLFYDAC